MFSFLKSQIFSNLINNSSKHILLQFHMIILPRPMPFSYRQPTVLTKQMYIIFCLNWQHEQTKMISYELVFQSSWNDYPIHRLQWWPWINADASSSRQINTYKERRSLHSTCRADHEVEGGEVRWILPEQPCNHGLDGFDRRGREKDDSVAGLREKPSSQRAVTGLISKKSSRAEARCWLVWNWRPCVGLRSLRRVRHLMSPRRVRTVGNMP
jgi:hypothetical protein